jgi:preprotein translocase subunit SecA
MQLQPVAPEAGTVPQAPSEGAAHATAPASPRADRPGAPSNGNAVPPARPAAAAASGSLARVTSGGRPAVPLPEQRTVRNIVESSGAGTRRVDAPAGAVRGATATNGKPGKVGRNQPCPCGSGKKYKYCHGR